MVTTRRLQEESTMTMSPFEVERQEFGRGPLGYRRKEVDRFLDEVQQTLMSLWQERSGLRETNERLEERVARFTALEEQLKNTLMLAQDSAEKACEQARRESELLMREAGQKARELVHSAHEERQRLEQSLRGLQSAEQDSRQRLRTLAQAVIGQLDESEESVSDSSTTLRAIVSPETPALPPVLPAAGPANSPAARRAQERMRSRDPKETRFASESRSGEQSAPADASKITTETPANKPEPVGAPS